MPLQHVKIAGGRQVKLGRIRPKSRPNAIRFSRYMKDATPPPASIDYASKAMASIGHMYLNDTLGDCVIAGKGHLVGCWTGNESGSPVIATDTEIDNAYVTICGPGDNGCNITDVLDYMKSEGMVLGGQAHKIDGYVAVDWTNQVEVETALCLFGGLTIGLNIPQAWVDSPDTWDVTNSPIVGGHDVTCVGYNATGVVVATWGSTRFITWAAFKSTTWLEESYAILGPDWYARASVNPMGIPLATLQADMADLGGGTIPPIDPTPTPVPVPVPIPTPTPTPTPVPTPVPVPVPVPTPVPPTPVGLTLGEAIAAVVDGIESGRPYSGRNVARAAETHATAALRAAWPAGA